MKVAEKPNLDHLVKKIYVIADKICSPEKDNKIDKRILFHMLANWMPSIKNITISTCMVNPLKPGESVELEDSARGHRITIKNDPIKGPVIVSLLNRYGKDASGVRWYYDRMIDKILILKKEHRLINSQDYNKQIALVYKWFSELERTLIKI